MVDFESMLKIEIVSWLRWEYVGQTVVCAYDTIVGDWNTRGRVLWHIRPLSLAAQCRKLRLVAAA